MAALAQAELTPTKKVVERLRAVAYDDHRVREVVGGQRLERELDIVGVVLGEQDLFELVHGLGRCTGKVKWNVAPPPCVDSARISPPCRWITRCTIASPMPV